MLSQAVVFVCNMDKSRPMAIDGGRECRLCNLICADEHAMVATITSECGSCNGKNVSEHNLSYTVVYGIVEYLPHLCPYANAIQW